MHHEPGTSWLVLWSLATLLAAGSACRRPPDAQGTETIPALPTTDAAVGRAPVEPPPPTRGDAAAIPAADAGHAPPATGEADAAGPADAATVDPPDAEDVALQTADVAPRPLPRGFSAVDGAGVHASGWPLAVRCLRDDSVMVLVPAGEFTSGLGPELLRRLAALEDPPAPGGDEGPASPARIALLAEQVRAGRGLRMLADQDLQDVEGLAQEQRAALAVLLFLDGIDRLLSADDLAQWKRGERSLTGLVALPSFPRDAIPDDVLRGLRLSAAELTAERLAAVAGRLAKDMEPETRVRIGAFYIDRYEITNAQYRRFVADDAGAAHRPGLRYNTDGYNILPQGEERLYDPWTDPERNRDDQPVTCVSADDAEAYARWARKDIPTHVQWERAAVGEGGRLFPWGSELQQGFCGCGFRPPIPVPENPSWLDLARIGIAVVRDVTRDPAAPADVGSFPRDVGPFGSFDLGGNVSEWVRGAGEGGADHVVLGGNVNTLLPSILVPARTQTYQEPGKLVGFRTLLVLEE